MSRLIRNFDAAIGPVISVAISDPLSRRAEYDSPRREKATMLLDTGATDSSIAGYIADRLGLPVLGLHDVRSFGHKKPSYQYIADLELELSNDIREFQEWKLLRFGNDDYDAIQGIIGRDILAKARFVLDGPRGEFTLEF